MLHTKPHVIDHEVDEYRENVQGVQDEIPLWPTAPRKAEPDLSPWQHGLQGLRNYLEFRNNWFHFGTQVCDLQRRLNKLQSRTKEKRRYIGSEFPLLRKIILKVSGLAEKWGGKRRDLCEVRTAENWTLADGETKTTQNYEIGCKWYHKSISRRPIGEKKECERRLENEIHKLGLKLAEANMVCKYIIC